ncbi:MAG: ABC transporter permease [Planctomycetia bacterium]|jgi:hypothetical protein
MVLEEEIPPFLTWLSPAVGGYAVSVALLGVVVAGCCWLVQSFVVGPVTAGDRVYRGIVGVGRDLAATSGRRTWALARLAMQESLRRHVLVVLGLFAVIMVFAGWFLDPTSVNPGKLRVEFILAATNFLVCAVTLLLAVFSLPADFKAKAIQTVTTKPARSGEIVLGRILGFALVGTGLLTVMGIAGWAFVARGVVHAHGVDAAQLVEIRDDEGTVIGYEGKTSVDHGHRHRVRLDAAGNGVAEAEQGHGHPIRGTGPGRHVVDGPEGILEARRPLRGRLSFLGRNGLPMDRGISVGDEWAYRSYIEGGTLAAAIWTFAGVTERDFPDGLPLELEIHVFRTHKGQIDKGIGGSIRVRNPVTRLQSDPIVFIAREATLDRQPIPRQLTVTAADGDRREVDLFEALVADGRVEVILQCLEPGQYYGVAQADCYLRAGDGSFAVNYAKSCLGIWLQMLLLTALGVVLSTVVAGPVALFGTLAILLVGQFRDFISKLFTSQVTGDSVAAPGGGPIESFYRIVTQASITAELEKTTGVLWMKTIDTLLLAPLRLAAGLFPSLSALGTSDFVAGGFDIPLNRVAMDVAETFGYLVVLVVAGAVFLRTREVGST